MVHNFKGVVCRSPLGGTTRQFIVGVTKYGVLKKVVKADLFNSATGEGEQRDIVERHKNSIKKAMKEGKYAPTSFSIGTRDLHRQNIKINGSEFSLEVDETNPLPLLDGGHRSGALDDLHKEGGATATMVDGLDIPYILYLDGNTKEDFLVLQSGKPVSRDHVLGLRIKAGLVDDKHAPYYNLAVKTAHILHENQESFCHNLVQFDSSSQVKLPISLNTLCSKAASDLAFSLYGGAKIAHSNNKDEKWLANMILKSYFVLKDDPSGRKLLEKGMVLAPIPNGTKAGTSFLLALGHMLAARCSLKQVDEPSEDDLQLLFDCAVEYLEEEAKGNTSSDRKRLLFKKFCLAFFDDLINVESDELEEDGEIDVPKKVIGDHEGIPVPLIRLLSPSTFGVSKLPTEKKKRGRKKGQKNQKNQAAVVAEAIIHDTDDLCDDDDDSEADIPVSPSPQKYYDSDPDAEAFEDEDEKHTTVLDIEGEDDDEEEAPWDKSF